MLGRKPTSAELTFYVNGTYETQVPAGSYEVVATKGPEYRVFKGAVDVKAGQLARVAIPLQRRWQNICSMVVALCWFATGGLCWSPARNRWYWQI